MEKIDSSSEKSHLRAVLLALLVTFLWSSSFVLIKFGLEDGLPPVTFAGLRYSFAFFSLFLLVIFNRKHRSTLRMINPALWIKLILLGILFYTITQGANFLGLSLLPANTVSLIYNFGPFFIALASGLITKETPTRIQWIGVLLSIIGALVYFLPLETLTGTNMGYLIAVIGMLACAFSSLLGRHVNLESGLPPIMITTISMGIGGLLLLIMGIITQGFGQLNFTQWLIIGWLAIANTALAFTLWNTALRTLSAVEASVINNTMLLQVAILAWVFLDEALSSKQMIGILLVVIAMVIVQFRERFPIIKTLK
jgi:drug/metabolite transporter (DMT)-like permease